VSVSGGPGPSAAFAEQLLCASVDLGRWEFEGVGDLKDVCERDVALAALDISVVAAVQAALEGEPFLGDAALFAQLAERVAECGVGLGEGWHAVRKVCPDRLL
jgi:hypothetical protein